MNDKYDASDPLPLTNLSTGVMMPYNLSMRLVQSFQLGHEQMEKFIKERLFKGVN